MSQTLNRMTTRPRPATTALPPAVFLPSYLEVQPDLPGWWPNDKQRVLDFWPAPQPALLDERNQS